MVGSQWSGKVGCFLVFFMIPSGAGNLHSNPDFQIHAIQRWSHLKTWNQSLVILDIPNFNPMKEALWYSHPLLRYSIFRDGPRLYLQKKEWYVHIVRGPCTSPEHPALYRPWISRSFANILERCASYAPNIQEIHKCPGDLQISVRFTLHRSQISRRSCFIGPKYQGDLRFIGLEYPWDSQISRRLTPLGPKMSMRFFKYP